jgi:hypothetical protein
MTCDQAIEILPWYLNGTLDAGEREEVRNHLATCERCRQALADTRQAWTVFAQHIPTQDLVALAWGQPPSGIDPAAAEEHLASCAECAAELEMVRMSRRLEEDDNVALFPAGKPRPLAGAAPRTWRAAALAAGLAAVVAMGGWIHTAQQVGDPTTQLAGTQTSAPSQEMQPGVGIDMGGGGVVRAESSAASIPNDQSRVLILTAGTSGELGAEILDAGDKPVKQMRLQPGPLGAYYVIVPSGMKPGVYTIRLQKDGALLPDKTWTFEVVEPSPAKP